MQKQISLGSFTLAAGQTLPSNDILDEATNREGLNYSIRQEGRSGQAAETAAQTQPGTRRPHLTIAVKGQTIQGFSF